MTHWSSPSKTGLVLLLLLFTNSNLFSQCITPDPTEEEYMAIPWYGDESEGYTILDYKYDSLMAIYDPVDPLARSVESVILRIPVKFWVHQNAPGIPGGNILNIPDEEHFQFIMDDANRAARDNGLKVQFFIDEVSNVYNPNWVDMNQAGERQAAATANHKESVLNVHIVDDGGDIVWTTIDAIFLNRESLTSATQATTFTHEIGHYFGLLHTFAFRGILCLKEPVSRNRILTACPPTGYTKRCRWTGDLLCDTDADPNMRENGSYDMTTCTWDPMGRKDHRGDLFHPNPDNYMAYGNNISNNDICRTDFTSGQKKWMTFVAFKGRRAVWKGWLPTANDAFDIYEPDNKAIAAREITPGEEQEHTFHSKGRTDVDWLYFTTPACSSVEDIHFTFTEVTNNAIGSVTFYLRNSDNTEGTIVNTSESGGVYTIAAGNLAPNQAYVIKITKGNSNSTYRVAMDDNIVSCIDGPGILCALNNFYSVPSLPSNTAITWSKSSNIAYVSGQGTRFYTVSGGSNGIGWVRATVTKNGQSYTLPQKDVHLGGPAYNSGEITGPETLSVNQTGIYTAPIATGGYVTYQWSFPYGGFDLVWGQGGRQVTIRANGSVIGPNSIQCKATNACGYTSRYKMVGVSSVGGGCLSTLAVSPNPSGGQIVAQIQQPDPCEDPIPLNLLDSGDDKNNHKEKEGDIIILNQAGLQVYRKKHLGKKFKLNLKHLNPGLYVMQYVDEIGEVVFTRFIIQ